jgi:hypothetical protein
VHLAVERLRLEREQVLLVQLERDLRKRRVHLVGLVQLVEPAAGFLREPLERSAGPCGGRATARPHRKRVDGHVVRQRVGLHAARAEHAGRVVAVAEDQHDAAALLLPEVEHRLIDRVPESRLVAHPQVELIPQELQQRVAVVRVARAQANLIREARDARAIVRQHADDERIRAVDHRVERRQHAAAAVEHDHRRDWLEIRGEARDRLDLAVVLDLEVVFREVGHEAARAVGDGRVDGHRAHAAAERLLRRCRLRLRRRLLRRHRRGRDGQQEHHGAR